MQMEKSVSIQCCPKRFSIKTKKGSLLIIGGWQALKNDAKESGTCFGWVQERPINLKEIKKEKVK